MKLSTQHRTRMAVALVVVTATVCAVSPVASGDDWARERAGIAALSELDPAIRTAIAAQAPSVPVVSPTPVAVEMPVSADGFAWAEAGIGVLVGIGVACFGLACVTLVRNDGRLRSA